MEKNEFIEINNKVTDDTIPEMFFEKNAIIKELFDKECQSNINQIIEYIKEKNSTDKIIIGEPELYSDVYNIITKKTHGLIQYEDLSPFSIVLEPIVISNISSSDGLQHIIFLESVQIENSVLEEDFIFKNCDFWSDLKITNCTFKKNLTFKSSQFGGSVYFDKLLAVEQLHFPIKKYSKNLQTKERLNIQESYFYYTTREQYLEDNVFSEYKLVINNYKFLKDIYKKNNEYQKSEYCFYLYKKYQRKEKINTLINELKSWNTEKNKKLRMSLILSIITTFIISIAEKLFIDKLSNYYTNPLKVFKNIFFIVIFIFPLIYAIACSPLFSKSHGEILYNNTSIYQYYNSGLEFSNNLSFDSILCSLGLIKDYILTCIYFSIITFTTIGYGDLQPTGIIRFIAAVEGFLGVFLIALFLVVLTRKHLNVDE